MRDLSQLTHVDVAQWARLQTQAQGQIDLALFARLWPEVLLSSDHTLSWQLAAYEQGQTKRSVWLRVQLQARVDLVCQTCLAPVTVQLQVDRAFRFVATEEQAALEDEASDEDVLAQPQDVNLFELAEDELLLALPLVPRHGGCISALHADNAVHEPRQPFAALADWKNRSY